MAEALNYILIVGYKWDQSYETIDPEMAKLSTGEPVIASRKNQCFDLSRIHLKQSFPMWFSPNMLYYRSYCFHSTSSHLKGIRLGNIDLISGLLSCC